MDCLDSSPPTKQVQYPAPTGTPHPSPTISTTSPHAAAALSRPTLPHSTHNRNLMTALRACPPFVNPTHNVPPIQMMPPATVSPQAPSSATTAQQWSGTSCGSAIDSVAIAAGGSRHPSVGVTGAVTACSAGLNSGAVTTHNIYHAPTQTNTHAGITSYLPPHVAQQSHLRSPRHSKVSKRRHEEKDIPDTSKVFINEDHMARRLDRLSLDNNNLDIHPNLEANLVAHQQYRAETHARRQERQRDRRDNLLVPSSHQPCNTAAASDASTLGNVGVGTADDIAMNNNNTIVALPGAMPTCHNTAVEGQERGGLTTRRSFRDVEDSIQVSDSDVSDIEDASISSNDSSADLPRLEFSEQFKHLQHTLNSNVSHQQHVLPASMKKMPCMDLMVWKPLSNPLLPSPNCTPCSLGPQPGGGMSSSKNDTLPNITQGSMPDVIPTHQQQHVGVVAAACGSANIEPCVQVEVDMEEGVASRSSGVCGGVGSSDGGYPASCAADMPLPMDDDDMEL